MANFWDLPKAVRETIYRLHLVRDKGVHMNNHDKMVQYKTRKGSEKLMPPICYVTKKIEKEAASIYYGENHFWFGPEERFAAGVLHFTDITFVRHWRLVRKVTVFWPQTCAREAFIAISKMKRLEELDVGVNELAMVRDMLKYDEIRHQHRCNDRFTPTPQQQLAVVRHPGMTGLLQIRNVSRVEFTNKHKSKVPDSCVCGPIPGGVLATQIKPMLTSLGHSSASFKAEQDYFPLLSLPPELRNRIYGQLLEIDGPLHPSPRPPTSAAKRYASKVGVVAPQSSLSLLAVNRQIHDEAVGIFYASNKLLFYYPAQLHAFVLTLGQQRQAAIRDITLRYWNTKSGGVDLIDLTLPILKQLTGLRHLRIVFKDELTTRLVRRYSPALYSMKNGNPMTMPGIKTLFSLRGIHDIKIRDTSVEQYMGKEKINKNKSLSDLAETSKEYCYCRLAHILDHLNAALADAQQGKVNKKMLEDDEWHMNAVFSELDDE